MTDHNLTLKHLSVIRDTLAPFAETIEKVGLFGSRATGNAKPGSDIDLVLYGMIDQRTLDRIHTLFTESMLPFTVDVQAYKLVQYPPLKKHIDEVMQPLFTQSDLTQR